MVDLLPFTPRGVYINFLGEEGEDHVRASYGVNYERLVALKNTYDPDNVFCFNQNIKPALGAINLPLQGDLFRS
ncbi:MAG TPA: BBE domain-containing protein [Ktedonobacteraceae bacterium]|nr:BBE domain-containing protein [Ktedonobacteraceae bacterium]